MSASKFKGHEQHVKFSEKTISDINEIGEDVLQKIKEMDQETSNNILVIILNDTIKSIFNLTCDLQEIVIKSYDDECSNSDLKTVVKKLSQDCNELVQEYENDRSVLKQKFEKFIENILHEAEGLFNIIKKDDLHAHKHELVEVLKEIMCTLHRMQMRVRIQNLTVHQLSQTIEDIRKQYSDDISFIENNCNPESLKNVVIHRRHTGAHAFDLACHLNKVASNFDGEIQHRILNAANLFSIAVAEWLLHSNNAELESDVTALSNGSDKLWAPLQDLIHYIENQHENKKTSKNLKDVVTHVIAYGMVNNNQTGRSIKHDST